ncbi:hypothetical protein LVJ94_30820 [Pendulispora rubella]|uniref:Uncharacterized protein n=1 Tax=Pendulispora rubella TaxID=2741070 RepID=A0ABZ2KRL0_9BACT
MTANGSVEGALVKALLLNRGRAWTLGALSVSFGVGVVAACGSNSDDSGIVTVNDAGADREPIIKPPPPHVPVSIAAGGSQACAIMDDGRLFCWGANTYGQLGNPQITALPDGGSAFDKRPVPFPQLASVGNVRQVAPGGPENEDGVKVANTCAILADAQAQCWGENKHEGLGRRKTTTFDDYNPHPDSLPVMGLGPAQQIITNGTTACALSDGHVWCWGQGQYWADGGGGGPRPSRLDGEDFPKTKHMAIGLMHGVEVDESGYVSGWGNSGYGQLGPNGARSVIHELYGAVEVAAGGFTTCARMRTGEVRCLGRNAFGLLGRGPSDDTNSKEAAAVLLPTDKTAATQIVMSINHACALLVDGSVWCWGKNFWGGLGSGQSNGATVDPPQSGTPLRVEGLPLPATSIAVGLGFTCALLSDRTVMCWGRNEDGNLGQGTLDTAPHLTPVRVPLW